MFLLDYSLQVNISVALLFYFFKVLLSPAQPPGRLRLAVCPLQTIELRGERPHRPRLRLIIPRPTVVYVLLQSPHIPAAV